MPADVGPVEITPHEPQPPNPVEAWTDEQVEAALNGAAQVASDDDAEAETEDSAPAEDAAPVEAAATVEETAEAVEPVADDDRSELRRELELSRLERQKTAAELERVKFLASRNAGEAGYLKKMMAERQRAESETGYAESSQDASDHPAVAELRKELGALKSDRVGQAIADAGAAFGRAHPDAKDLWTELQAVIGRQSDEDIQAALHSDDPKLARITAKSILESAYAEVKIEHLKKQEADAKLRSADQTTRIRAQKANAGPPGVQRVQAQERAPAPRRIDQLSDAELDAVLDARIRRGG